MIATDIIYDAFIQIKTIVIKIMCFSWFFAFKIESKCQPLLLLLLLCITSACAFQGVCGWCSVFHSFSDAISYVFAASYLLGYHSSFNQIEFQSSAGDSWSTIDDWLLFSTFVSVHRTSIIIDWQILVFNNNKFNWFRMNLWAFQLKWFSLEMDEWFKLIAKVLSVSLEIKYLFFFFLFWWIDLWIFSVCPNAQRSIISHGTLGSKFEPFKYYKPSQKVLIDLKVLSIS